MQFICNHSFTHSLNTARVKHRTSHTVVSHQKFLSFSLIKKMLFQELPRQVFLGKQIFSFFFFLIEEEVLIFWFISYSAGTSIEFWNVRVCRLEIYLTLCTQGLQYPQYLRRQFVSWASPEATILYGRKICFLESTGVWSCISSFKS